MIFELEYYSGSETYRDVDGYVLRLELPVDEFWNSVNIDCLRYIGRIVHICNILGVD